MDHPRNIVDLFRNPWARILIEALSIVAVVWVLHALSSVLTPLLVGLVLAYMLDPLVNWISRGGIPRRVAVTLVFGGGLIAVLAALALSLPKAWQEGRYLYNIAFVGDLFKDVGGPDGNSPADGVWQANEPLLRDINHNKRYDPSVLQRSKVYLVEKGWLKPELDVVQPPTETEKAAAIEDAKPLDEMVRDYWARVGGGSLFARLGSIIGSLGYWALTLLLIPVYGYFFSLNLQRVSSTIVAHIPLRHRERTLRILGEINLVVGAFFRGRLAVCGILGVLAAAGFGIAGVPSFLVLGLLMGLGTAIPLAAVLILLPVCMLLYIAPETATWQYVVVAITFALIQGLEPVLIAAIMGKGVEMHPVLIVVSILAFGTLLGGVGVLLAVPLAATARILIREFVYPHVRRLAGLDESHPPLATVTPV